MWTQYNYVSRAKLDDLKPDCCIEGRKIDGRPYIIITFSRLLGDKIWKWLFNLHIAFRRVQPISQRLYSQPLSKWVSLQILGVIKRVFHSFWMVKKMQYTNLLLSSIYECWKRWNARSQLISWKVGWIFSIQRHSSTSSLFSTKLLRIVLNFNEIL
jgi:hypothetical protein